MSIEITIDESNVSVYDGTNRYHGTFCSTQDQTNAASVNKMTYNVTELTNGVTIASNSRITFANSGIYNIQFSAQLDKSDSGDDSVDIWLMKNGANVSNSNTEMTLVGNNGKHVAAWNWVVQVNSGEYYEIAWYSADAQVFLNYVASNTNPTRPAIPSVILTVTQI